MYVCNTFRHLSLQIYELYKEYASKKAKKIKRNKMEQSRFAALCYFCAYNYKKLFEILNFKKIMTIFALSIKKDWRLRGERLSLGKSAHTLCVYVEI